MAKEIPVALHYFFSNSFYISYALFLNVNNILKT